MENRRFGGDILPVMTPVMMKTQLLRRLGGNRIGYHKIVPVGKSVG
ncbi:hypothetical protein yrohd0001_11490 [Yersinia rohdei ATCC 43380]|nr:hypothetical protein yrohd0001_11490 [Yersinia rohdei ATCC 43380]